MFQKILIANRGEIACVSFVRVKKWKIKTVAVFSTADKDNIKLADERFCIGPPASKDSYLKMDSILIAAEITKADAIHPGYGFSRERDICQKMCGERNQIYWTHSGANPCYMGDKITAKATLINAKYLWFRFPRRFNYRY